MRPVEKRCTFVALLALSVGCADEPALLSGDSCAVEVETLVELRGDRVNRSGVGLLTDNYILLVSNVDLASIEVFDVHGTFIRTLGGRGDGPGEFVGIMELRELADGRIAAIDGRSARITYFTRDLSFDGTMRIPAMIYPHGAQPLPDGGWLLSGMMSDRDHFGSAVVEVDSSGVPRSYYGADETEKVGPRRGLMETRLLAYHGDVGIVTMKVNDFALEMWSAEGQLRERLDLDVEWFVWPPPWFGRGAEEGGTTAVAGEPVNQVTALQFDSSGRLWILAQVTPEDWREGLNDAGQVVDRAKYADFMLYVYDPRLRRSVCTVRLQQHYYFGGFAGPGILKTYDEDRGGHPRVAIHRLRLMNEDDDGRAVIGAYER